MTRRTFLFFTFIGTLINWTSGYPIETLLQQNRANIDDSLKMLTRLFSDLEIPKALGRRYLEVYPSDSNRAELLRDLFPPDLRSPTARNLNHLKRYLVSRRERDFQEECSVLLDGWVLARTEARVCALIALM